MYISSNSASQVTSKGNNFPGHQTFFCKGLPGPTIIMLHVLVLELHSPLTNSSGSSTGADEPSSS